MADQFGHNAFLGLGREAAWGTAATITDWVRLFSHDFKNNTPMTVRNLLGTAEPVGAVAGPKSTAGGPAFEMLYQGCEVPLAYFFGAPTISLDTPVVGANTWVFKPQLNIYAGKGLTCETSYGDWSILWAGHKFDSFGFSQEAQSVLKATLGGAGKSWAVDVTPTTASYPTDRPCLETEFTFEINDIVSTNIRGWTCGPTNALSADRAILGAAYVKEPGRGGYMGITGSWTSWYTDNAIRTVQNTNTPVKLEFIYTATYFVVGATPYQLVLDFPKAYILGDSPPVPGPGAVEETNNFIAVHGAAGYAMRLTIVNGRTALPAES